MGQDHNAAEYGWKAEVNRKLGLPEGTIYRITCAAERGELHGVHPKTIDMAIASTGIPPAAFYDSEYKK